MVPTASYTFYALNCSTGIWFFFHFFLEILLINYINILVEREEISITTSQSFLITLPLSSKTDNCVEESVECVSGDTLSTVGSQVGCEVMYFII